MKSDSIDTDIDNLPVIYWYSWWYSRSRYLSRMAYLWGALSDTLSAPRVGVSKRALVARNEVKNETCR